MDWLGWVTLAFCVFGILYSFNFIDSDMDADDWKRIGKAAVYVVFFIPIVAAGALVHVSRDFKNHKTGYIMLFLVLAFVGFGFYMGYKAGPAGPGPWQ